MTTQVLQSLAVVALASSALMLALYLVQRATADGGIADAGWAFGLAAAAVYYAAVSDGDPARRIAVAILGGLWGARLAYYILVDRVLRGDEDGRYRRMRDYWGPRAQVGFFFFFQAQALAIVLFSIPFLGAALHRGPRADEAGNAPAMLIAAFGVWLVAILGETTADRQLARFRADPANRGRVCTRGLWRYSRHPNYFFEWLHWWSYCLIGFGDTPGWLTLVGPVVMLLFLFRVTGIPYTEQQALASRGDAYREYQRTTSAFVPWFPKRARG